MSRNSRLAARKAAAHNNEEQIEELSHTPGLQNNHSIKTKEELSQLEEGFRKEYASFSVHSSELEDTQPVSSRQLVASPVARNVPQTKRHMDQHIQPPGPIPGPFYLAAREASQLYLDFVIPGCKGETFEVAVNKVDLAFILQQSLRRRGWGEANTKKGVEDFLEQPMMKVTWMGGYGEFGNLS